MSTPDAPTPTPNPDSAPGGQGDATSEAVWRDRGEIIARLQSKVAHLERECLDRESTEADARSRLGVADSELAPLRARVEELEAERVQLRADMDHNWRRFKAAEAKRDEWFGMWKQANEWSWEQRDLRVAAEAERDAIRQADSNLRAALKMLADDWPTDEAGPFRYALKMVLDQSAALASSAPAVSDGCVCSDDFCLGAEDQDGPGTVQCAACLALDPELPCQREAVSDGEGATSEAGENDYVRGIRAAAGVMRPFDQNQAGWKTGQCDRATVRMMVELVESMASHAQRRLRPAPPVVAPSATDGGGGER